MAELLLRPKQHYRYLPPFLRALDRVVNVQSSIKTYPLPTQPTPYMSGLPNGTGSALLSSSAAAAQLGSDESLGGALLTPIPWLRQSQEDTTGTNGNSQMELQSDSTEMVEGPNGTGRIETVSVVNGVVVTTIVDSATSTSAERAAQEGTPEEDLEDRALSVDGGMEEDEERPHARGPDVLGPEDLGPQPGYASAAMGLDEKGNTSLAAGSEAPSTETTVDTKADKDSSPEVQMADAQDEPEAKGEEAQSKSDDAEDSKADTEMAEAGSKENAGKPAD